MSPCHWMNINGTVVHLNMAKPRARKCSKCGRPSSKLCDFVVSPPEQITHKKTCDKPLCDVCAVHVPGEDIDYCQEHADKLGVSLIL
jgi:hypothetical protein